MISFLYLSSAEDSEKVSEALDLQNKDPLEILFKRNNIEITRKQFSCWNDGNWLSDEVINCYFDLLTFSFRDIFCFNSFFWVKLSSNGRAYDYDSVKKWTRKKNVNLFQYKLIFVPLHLDDSHWALGVVEVRNRLISYWDSLGVVTHKKFIEYMNMYLKEEWKQVAEADTTFDYFSEREDASLILRVQTNEDDCGVLVCFHAISMATNMHKVLSKLSVHDLRILFASQLLKGTI